MTLTSEQLRRIIVRGTNWVGDAVMTVPALRELRGLLPNAHITLATRSWARDLFEGTEFIDDLLVEDRRGLSSVPGQVKDWKSGGFDLAILFTNSFQSALIPALARIRWRLGYATERRSLFLTHPVKLPEWRSSRHEVYYYLNLIEQLRSILGTAPRRDVSVPNCALKVSTESQEEARALLQTNGVVAGRPLIALCPGSINSRAKRWPAERYAALADRLIKELGASVLLIGSAEELDVSLDVKSRMSQPPLLLTGKTTLGQLVGVLNQMDLLISNDTGPSHIASALGRPTLTIFGPTNPLTTRPCSESAELLRHPPDCAPCMLRDCPIDHRCMTAISPDEVFQKALSMLKAPVFI